MQEMLYPTTFLKGLGLGKACGLITDGRFSGGTSGLSIGHISPEAASGGAIGLVRERDRIVIDIPSRTISLAIDDAELDRRRKERGPHWVRILEYASLLMKNLELLVWRFSLSLLVIVRERAFFVHLNKLVDLLP